jgi:hypothetical protein
VDDLPILHNRTTSFVLFSTLVGAELIFFLGIAKLWGYSRQNDPGLIGKLAHGLTSVVG